MKKFIIYNLCILSLFSCEKIWVEELHERACDTIRGLYDPVSIVWEEAEPIDINGDGEASYDYLAEWDKVISGSPGNNSIHNDRATLDIPYVLDANAEFSDYPSLSRRHIPYDFNINVIIEGNDSHLEFELPDDGSEFYHTDDPHGIRHNQGRDRNNFHQICQNAVYCEVIFINLCDI